jgi:isocitrate lyase
MVAALRSEFGPLPDQSMHENYCSSFNKEIYDFLRQADAIELNDLFRRLEKEKMYKIKLIISKHISFLILLILMQVLNEEATLFAN